jgi:hypothetical protein
MFVFLSPAQNVVRRLGGNELRLIGITLAYPLARIRELMQRKHLEAHVTCFWFGSEGEPEPAIPPEAATIFAHLPTDIETDFRTG